LTRGASPCRCCRACPGRSGGGSWWRSGGFASKNPALPLPVEAPFPRDVTGCVLCRRVQETFVVTRIGKKPGVRGGLEMIALVENSWRAVCVVFWFCGDFLFLFLNLSLPPPQKKRVFSSFFCTVFFSYCKICLENGACPQRSLLTTATERIKPKYVTIRALVFS